MEMADKLKKEFTRKQRARSFGAWQKKSSGFTLIEVMIVLAVFSIAVLGTLTLQTGSVTGNANARKTNLAMNYMQDTMERLMRLGVSEDKFGVDDDGVNGIDDAGESQLNDGVDNDDDGTVDEADENDWHRMAEFAPGGGHTRGTNIPVDNYLSGIYNLTWTITDIDCSNPDPPNIDGKQIDMTVTWDGGANTINMTGVRTSVF